MNTIWCEHLGEPFTSGYLDAGGIRTRYVEAGDGPIVILLHGRGGHLENWTRNLAPLAKHFRVIAIDMMGHGFSAKPEADYAISGYASHVQAVLNTIGADRVSL